MNAAGSDAPGTAQHPDKPVGAGAGGGVVGGAAGSAPVHVAANGGSGGAGGSHVAPHPAAGSGGSTAPSHPNGGAGGAAPAAGSGGTQSDAGAGGSAGDTDGAAGSESAAGSGGSGDGGGAGQAAPPALKYDCPASNADADANGYPDACEQLLWTEETLDLQGAMVFPLYTLQTTSWTLDMRATIDSSFRNEVIDDQAGALPGTFVANGQLFSGVYDEEIFDASTQYNATRVAAALYTGTGDYEYSEPSAGNIAGFNNSSEPGTLINLHGKHVVYFTRVITGYGFDGSNDQQGHPRNLVGLRGGWRAYGY
jgi:hypothetical protein